MTQQCTSLTELLQYLRGVNAKYPFRQEDDYRKDFPKLLTPQVLIEALQHVAPRCGGAVAPQCNTIEYTIWYCALDCVRQFVFTKNQFKELISLLNTNLCFVRYYGYLFLNRSVPLQLILHLYDHLPKIARTVPAIYADIQYCYFARITTDSKAQPRHFGQIWEFVQQRFDAIKKNQDFFGTNALELLLSSKRLPRHILDEMCTIPYLHRRALEHPNSHDELYESLFAAVKKHFPVQTKGVLYEDPSSADSPQRDMAWELYCLPVSREVKALLINLLAQKKIKAVPKQGCIRVSQQYVVLSFRDFGGGYIDWVGPATMPAKGGRMGGYSNVVDHLHMIVLVFDHQGNLLGCSDDSVLFRETHKGVLNRGYDVTIMNVDKNSQSNELIVYMKGKTITIKLK